MSYSSEVLADSPIIYLRLNETSGTTATDASGNGNHGTYIGQYVLAQTGLIGSDPSSKSVLFSDSVGTPGKVSIPVVTLAMTWTIEMVVKPVSGTITSGNQCLFVARSGENFNNAIWVIYEKASQRIQVYGTTSEGIDVFSNVYTTSIPSDSTYHVVAVLDGSAARLYINGTEVASDTSLTGTISITTSTTDGAYAIAAPIIGSYLSEYSGYIDEVAIYSGSYLSSARVAAHYAAIPGPVAAQGFPPPATRGTQCAAYFPVHHLRL